MNLFWTFITAIPEIIKLLQVLQKAIDDAETERKVSDDVKTIHEALSSGDATKLNAVFNPSPK
jgi:hypothetical protein